MVAELVETSRLWGRIAARIEPEWVEPVAQHLIKRSYSEPHWERAQGAVMATEKVTVYGLPIVAARKVNYSQIDPALCRELFIRHALVEGDWQTRHAFFRENLKLRAEVEELEHKSRRRDIPWMTIPCLSFMTSVLAMTLFPPATLIVGGKNQPRDAGSAQL